MIEYAILGTSHEIQDSPEVARQAEKDIQTMGITLVAEEYPMSTASSVCTVAARLEIPYLQIDPPPEEWSIYGIDYEMNARLNAACLQGQDIRLSHADRIREDLWLQKIENKIKSGRVLIVCGYLHLNFLAENIETRGCIVVAKGTFPTCLLDRKPDKILDLPELKGYLQSPGASKKFPHPRCDI